MSKISYQELTSILMMEGKDFIWIAPTLGRRKQGAKAGCINKRSNDLYIEISGTNYKASHLSWLYHNEEHPKYRLEHINGDNLDNRIENLKEYIPGSAIVDQELVRRLFRYEDGSLIWANKLSKLSRCKIGSNAGHVSKQKDGEYRFLKIGGKRYKTANIVWLYHHGVMPYPMLDHINHIKTDDRIENLREVTNQENTKNTSLRKSNTSGVSGVHFVGGKWVARINNSNGDRMYLGSFSTLEAAKQARKIAKKIYNYHENHGENA